MSKELDYRVPTSPADAAMLLESGVKFMNESCRVHYDKSETNPFRFGSEPLGRSWQKFLNWKPIMPKPHWSSTASEENPIPVYVWDGDERPKSPRLGYLRTPKSSGWLSPYCLYNSDDWDHAEPICKKGE